MTPCVTVEDRLIDYDELDDQDRSIVDMHLATCAACGRYVSTLAKIESALTAYASDVHLRGDVAATLRRSGVAVQVGPVSAVPEWLDLAAAVAIVVSACGLVWSTRMAGLLIGR